MTAASRGSLFSISASPWWKMCSILAVVREISCWNDYGTGEGREQINNSSFILFFMLNTRFFHNLNFKMHDLFQMLTSWFDWMILMLLKKCVHYYKKYFHSFPNISRTLGLLHQIKNIWRDCYFWNSSKWTVYLLTFSETFRKSENTINLNIYIHTYLGINTKWRNQ